MPRRCGPFFALKIPAGGSAPGAPAQRLFHRHAHMQMMKKKSPQPATQWPHPEPRHLLLQCSGCSTPRYHDRTDTGWCCRECGNQVAACDAYAHRLSSEWWREATSAGLRTWDILESLPELPEPPPQDDEHRSTLDEILRKLDDEHSERGDFDE